MKSSIQAVLVVFLSVLASSCGNGKVPTPLVKTGPKKYIIIVDVSDRLLQPNQASKDSAVISAVFEAFRNTVMDKMIIQSSDKFLIRILYQQGSRLDFESYSDSLSIDLGNYQLGDKKKKLIEFQQNLPGMISRLYQTAILGNSSNDYEGVDIWQYFKDQIATDIDESCKNHVVIITDGYFDFNEMGTKFQEANRFTTTSFLSKLPKKDWEQKSSQLDLGIIPVKLPREVNWIVCGINSKKKGDQLENEQLCFFWNKWLEESTGEKHNLPLISSSPQKMVDMIKRML